MHAQPSSACALPFFTGLLVSPPLPADNCDASAGLARALAVLHWRLTNFNLPTPGADGFPAADVAGSVAAMQSNQARPIPAQVPQPAALATLTAARKHDCCLVYTPTAPLLSRTLTVAQGTDAVAVADAATRTGLQTFGVSLNKVHLAPTAHAQAQFFTANT